MRIHEKYICNQCRNSFPFGFYSNILVIWSTKAPLVSMRRSPFYVYVFRSALSFNISQNYIADRLNVSNWKIYPLSICHPVSSALSIILSLILIPFISVCVCVCPSQCLQCVQSTHHQNNEQFFHSTDTFVWTVYLLNAWDRIDIYVHLKLTVTRRRWWIWMYTRVSIWVLLLSNNVVYDVCKYIYIDRGIYTACIDATVFSISRTTRCAANTIKSNLGGCLFSIEYTYIQTLHMLYTYIKIFRQIETVMNSIRNSFLFPIILSQYAVLLLSIRSHRLLIEYGHNLNWNAKQTSWKNSLNSATVLVCGMREHLHFSIIIVYSV